MSKQGTMAKYWCGTQNGLTGEIADTCGWAWELMRIPREETKDIGYMTFGKEYGINGKKHSASKPLSKEKKKGNHHMQIYVQFTKQKRLTAIRKLFSMDGTRATTYGTHWEKQMAKAIQGDDRTPNEIARDYCWKEGNEKYEWGVFVAGGRGKRNDIHDAVAVIERTGDIKSLLEEGMSVQLVKYHGGFQALAKIVKESMIPQHRPVKVYWFWGPTRSGKTWTASDGRTHESYAIKKGCTFRSGYWPEYRGEKRLIIDEWTSSSMHISQLMAFMDGDKFYCNDKYGGNWAEWEELFITSNFRYPETVYPGAYPANRAALFARIDKAIEFTKHWKEQTPVIYDSENEEEIGQRVPEDGSGKPPLKRYPTEEHGFIFTD